MAGRPSSFKTEYIEQAYKLCLLGATDKQMCDFFGVNEKTFNNWKHKHPEFLQSLKNGKEIADSQIAKSLFNRAKGYSCKATKFATFNGEITDREEYIENYPPDTTACIFWLKNRQPDKWRDKQEIITTPDNEVREKYLEAMKNLNADKMGEQQIQRKGKNVSGETA